MCKALHTESAKNRNCWASKPFSGTALGKQLPDIKRYTEAFKAKTLLDYGAGKGQLYHSKAALKFADKQYRGAEGYLKLKATCYDPAYSPHAKRPSGRFDAVICTDVLQYCPRPCQNCTNCCFLVLPLQITDSFFVDILKK